MTVTLWIAVESVERYSPMDCTSLALPCMQLEPSDKRFVVPGGTLLYHPNRDDRHPYMYTVENHPLDTRVERFKGRMIVFIQDTSKDAIDRLRAFESELRIPVGPDHTIPELGMFYMQFD